jgi:outer membrane protein assembly factor BamB
MGREIVFAMLLLRLVHAESVSAQTIAGAPPPDQLQRADWHAVIDTSDAIVHPCLHDARFREFDFWIGDWDVRPNGAPAGSPAARNNVTLEESGCIVMEHWEGARGSTGQSFNIFDRSSGKWRQTWVDNGGGQHDYTGSLVNGNMVFEGTTPAPGGRLGRIPTRLTLFHVSADTVRQFSQSSADSGKTWTTNYDFIYVRKPHDPIDGTVWLGSLTSPTGSTPFGVEFRRTARGALVLVEYLPVMHLYSQVVSRVTRRGEVYTFDDLPGSARLDGRTLRGVAFYARMPFEMERASKLPVAADPPVAAFPAGPTPLWTRALGAAAWASPVVRDGTVYVGTADGHLHAIRARDGTHAWTWADSTPIYGEALVTSDAVFVVNDRTELVRLDRSNGRLLWRIPLDSARRHAATVPDDDTFSHRTAAPVLAAGVLFVGSTDGHMMAIDPLHGTTTWRVDAGAKICAPAAVAGDLLIVGAMDGALLALRRSDGAIVWRTRLGAGIVSAPVIHGGTAIVGARDYLLHGVRLTDGGDAWTQHFWASWVESTPRIADGVLYVGSSDLRAVRALDPSTGAVLWSTDVLGAAWGSPVVAGDAVYMGVAAVKGYMISQRPSLIALDRRTGIVLWRQAGAFDTDAPVSGYAAAPAYANHTVFAAGLDGNLVALPGRR